MKEIERTLNIMEAELKSICEQLCPLQKNKIELERDIRNFKLENALYHPMSELANYKGREIRSITLVEKMRDGKLGTEYMYNDEYFEVTDGGHLHYSSYQGGCMDYYEEDGKYRHYYYGHATLHDYIGFLEIELEEEREDTE